VFEEPFEKYLREKHSRGVERNVVTHTHLNSVTHIRVSRNMKIIHES